MTSLFHKTYCISVDSTPDALRETLFRPMVDVGSKEGKSLVTIGTTQTFATQSDAELYGLQMGKRWVKVS